MHKSIVRTVVSNSCEIDYYLLYLLVALLSLSLITIKASVADRVIKFWDMVLVMNVADTVNISTASISSSSSTEINAHCRDTAPAVISRMEFSSV